MTVATAGTGGGFKFCAARPTSLDASRPIKDEEAAACKAKGIDYTEVIVANDGLSVVVNPENSWAMPHYRRAAQDDVVAGVRGQDQELEPDRQLFPRPAADPVRRAGTDSGTFDYFTEAINGEEGASRTDYSPSG